MFQSWNVIPFQWSKQRARLLDADQFTWSQLRFLSESSKDHIWILCANKTSQMNKANLSETFCILGFELQNAAQQFFLKTTVSQCSRTTRNLLISSALSGSRDPTLQIFNLYKDYKLHSWWPVLLLQFCCQCCARWFLFFFDNILFVYFFWIQKYSGWRRSSRIGNWWFLLRALGSKKWPNNRLDHITAAMCQLLWIFHCLRIDFQCNVD